MQWSIQFKNQTFTKNLRYIYTFITNYSYFKVNLYHITYDII